MLVRFRSPFIAWVQLITMTCWTFGLPLAQARWVPDANGNATWEYEDGNGPPPGGADVGDDDNDMLQNWFEDYLGTDRFSPDSDGDVLTDYEEAMNVDAQSGVCLYEPLIWDTNGDGYSDSENFFGTDGPGGDIDGDGLTNAVELEFGTNRRDSDSDDDGWSDLEEYNGNAAPEADPDGDELTNAQEAPLGTNPKLADTDGDGFNDKAEVLEGTNPLDPASNPSTGGTLDSDGDGLTNHQENYVYLSNPTVRDTDGDGLEDGVVVLVHGSNPTLTDSDGDSLSDPAEVALGTHPAVADTDNDGLNDAVEAASGSLSSPMNADTDGDGLSDGYEVNTSHTSPNDIDSDDDGISDYDEAMNIQPDADGDGINDLAESVVYYTNPQLFDTDGDGLSDGAEVGLPTPNPNPTNPQIPDSDYDGLTDGFEITTSNTNPNVWDSNGNGRSDKDDHDGTDSRDEDNDGLTNDQETALNTDKFDADTDNDGLTDGAEVNVHHTHPLLADTDTDGLDDGTEHLSTHTSPADDDSDDDGLLDGYEVLTAFTNPLVTDTDIDGLSDSEELQIYGTNPLNKHSLSPLYPDYNMVVQTDSDGGGIPDRIEAFYGMNPGTSADDLTGDLDADHVLNIDAYNLGWDLRSHFDSSFDSDHDGMTNGWEQLHGLDKNNPADRGGDPDGDWITNLEEFRRWTRPDTANDFPSVMGHPVPTGLTWADDGNADWDNDSHSNNLELDNSTNPRTPECHCSNTACPHGNTCNNGTCTSGLCSYTPPNPCTCDPILTSCLGTCANCSCTGITPPSCNCGVTGCPGSACVNASSTSPPTSNCGCGTTPDCLCGNTGCLRQDCPGAASPAPTSDCGCEEALAACNCVTKQQTPIICTCAQPYIGTCVSGCGECVCDNDFCDCASAGVDCDGDCECECDYQGYGCLCVSGRLGVGCNFTDCYDEEDCACGCELSATVCSSCTTTGSDGSFPCGSGAGGGTDWELFTMKRMMHLGGGVYTSLVDHVFVIGFAKVNGADVSAFEANTPAWQTGPDWTCVTIPIADARWKVSGNDGLHTSIAMGTKTGPTPPELVVGMNRFFAGPVSTTYFFGGDSCWATPELVLRYFSTWKAWQPK